jgi:hypothetical protein
LDKPLHVIYTVSKIAYRILVILIVNERVKKKTSDITDLSSKFILLFEKSIVKFFILVLYYKLQAHESGSFLSNVAEDWTDEGMQMIIRGK